MGDKKIFLHFIIFIIAIPVILLVQGSFAAAAGLKTNDAGAGANVTLITAGNDASIVETFSENFTFTVKNLNSPGLADITAVVVTVPNGTTSQYIVNNNTITDPSGWGHVISLDSSSNISVISWTNLTVSGIQPTDEKIFSFNLTAPPVISNTTHSWNIKVNFSDGSLSNRTESSTIIDDNIPPAISASPQMHINQTVGNATFVANFTITDNIMVANASIEIDGTNYTPTNQGDYYTYQAFLTPSNHIINAYANDSSGNENSILNGEVLYNTPPFLSVKNDTNTSVSSSNPIIYIAVADNEQASVDVDIYVNDSADGNGPISIGNDTVGSFELDYYGDGIYSYYASASDTYTNSVSAGNYTLIVDTTPPIIISPLGSTVTIPSFTANITVTDNIYLENVSIEIDSFNYTPTKQGDYYTYDAFLAPGRHVINVYANDSAGNEVNLLDNWVIYNTLPTINITSEGNTSLSFIVIDNEQNTTNTELIANGTNMSYSADISNNTSYAFAIAVNLSNEGIWNYYIRAYDGFGNNVSEGNRTLVIDFTKPTIANNSNMPLNQTIAGTSWLANFTITDNIYLDSYSVEINGINYTLTRAVNYFTRQFTLSEGSNYTVKAYANDTTGNEGAISGWVYVQPSSSGPGGGPGGGPGSGPSSGSVTPLGTKPEPTASPTKQLTTTKTTAAPPGTTPSTTTETNPANVEPQSTGGPTGFVSLLGRNSILAAMIGFIVLSSLLGYYYFTRKRG